jgi:hypothetical protein
MEENCFPFFTKTKEIEMAMIIIASLVLIKNHEMA